MRSKARRLIVAAASLAVGVTGLGGCLAPRPLSSSPDATRAALLRLVPVGTDVAQARATMKRLGIPCTPMVNRTFSADAPRPPDSTGETPIDFLYCDRSRLGFLHEERWQIAIVHEQGRVRDIGVSVGVTGL